QANDPVRVRCLGVNGAAPVRGELLYRGKAKSVYATDQPDLVIIHFRDDATDFDGRKRAEIPGKGAINNRISALLFAELARSGIATHFIRQLGPDTTLARAVRIIPLEVVVRNKVAGSLARRLGLPEGQPLARPVLEHYYKRDDLGDPLVNRDHIRALDIAPDEVVDRMEALARAANAVLVQRLARAGLELVDMKLEFGWAGEALLVADEISPDTTRVWDAATGARLDKDRFRRDLGPVLEGYQEILRRLEASEPAGGQAPGANDGGAEADRDQGDGLT